MSMNDPLANALSSIVNSEQRAKGSVQLRPLSRMLRQVLDIMNQHGYIGATKETDDGRGGFAEVNLIGKINKCGVIKPRFAFKKAEFEKYEKRFLPAKDFGVLIVSTSKGVMSHYDAKKQGLGGKLLAFVY